MKRALLTVSFGTSYPDTRRQTIESIEQDLQKAFPDRLFARAWSSSFLRRKVKDREGVSVDSPADALRKYGSRCLRRNDDSSSGESFFHFLKTSE